MTVAEIAKDIATKRNEWGTPYEALLREVSEQKPVSQCLTEMINKSIDMSVPVKQPHQKIAMALKLSSIASFRLGLLVGIIMDKPVDPAAPHIDPEPPLEEKCEFCHGLGETCIKCGQRWLACECGPGCYSPVQCEGCGGTGLVKQ